MSQSALPAGAPEERQALHRLRSGEERRRFRSHQTFPWVVGW